MEGPTATGPLETRPTETLLQPSPGAWQRDRVLLFLMLVAVLLGLIYNGAVLVGYGPDEPRHMAYVQLLLEERRFPFIQADGTEYRSGHSLHPPLYYLLLVPGYALTRFLPGQWEWHLLRLVSLALCVAALPLVYQIARRAVPGNATVAHLAVAHLALLPIFGMTGGTINNDSSNLLAVVLFLYLLSVRYADDRSHRSAVMLGVCFGLGGLCKTTVLICDGAALLLYMLAQDGPAVVRSPRAWQRLGIVLALVALLSGPWYARNKALYGGFTPPIAGGYTSPMLPSPQQGVLVMMMHDNFPPLFVRANWSIFYTLWSQKDWIPGPQPDLRPALQPSVDLRPPIYFGLVGYCLAALAGSLQLRGRRRLQRLAAEGTQDEGAGADSATTHAEEAPARVLRSALWPAYGAFAANWLACLGVALFAHWGWAEGGRYLLPALGGFAVALARGWWGLGGSRGLNIVFLAWCGCAAALNGVTVYWLLAFLNPIYGPKG